MKKTKIYNIGQSQMISKRHCTMHFYVTLHATQMSCALVHVTVSVIHHEMKKTSPYFWANYLKINT